MINKFPPKTKSIRNKRALPQPFRFLHSQNEGRTRTIITNYSFLYRGYLKIAALNLSRSTLNDLWLITYSSYGLVTSSGNITQPLQWSSEYADTDLGLIYYNYRHYNPLDGRWTGRDPIGNRRGLNAYSYVNNHVYYAYDDVGLYELFNENSITIVYSNSYLHDRPEYLGTSTTKFLSSESITSRYKEIKNGNAQKYCTDFPELSYTPTITYYLAKERARRWDYQI